MIGPELLPTRLMRACAAVLPVDAAGLSIFTKFGHRVPLGASDDTAALAERLQFTTGQGPCLTAHDQDRAVLATGVVMADRWPVFSNELLARTPYRSILSFPIDGHGWGGDAALDLYFRQPHPVLQEAALDDLQEVTDLIGDLLVTGAEVPGPGTEPAWLDNDAVTARSQVWIAVGMINVALRLNTLDALATLRGYAYSHGSTIDHIAQDLTRRELPIQALLDD